MTHKKGNRSAEAAKSRAFSVDPETLRGLTQEQLRRAKKKATGRRRHFSDVVSVETMRRIVN